MASDFLIHTEKYVLGSDIAIGCFVCSSYNGSNPQCDDPFNATALYLSDLGIPGSIDIRMKNSCTSHEHVLK